MFPFVALAQDSLTSGANIGVGDGSSIIATDTYVSTENKRQAGYSGAPAIQATHPCTISIAGGLGVPGGGLTFGRSKVDAECDLRETARLAHEMGRTEFAFALLCSSKTVRDSGVEC
jgi:hypothetical protein